MTKKLVIGGIVIAGGYILYKLFFSGNNTSVAGVSANPNSPVPPLPIVPVVIGPYLPPMSTPPMIG